MAISTRSRITSNVLENMLISSGLIPRIVVRWEIHFIRWGSVTLNQPRLSAKNVCSKHTLSTEKCLENQALAREPRRGTYSIASVSRKVNTPSENKFRAMQRVVDI